MEKNMFGMFLSELTGGIIGAIISVLVTVIATYGGVYIKKLDTKLKRKTLLDEINRYIEWLNEATSFTLMDNDEKINTVYEKAMEFSYENDIRVSEKELRLMIERAMNSQYRLQSIGLKLMQKKLSNDKGEK
jgi:hypothetical protein